MRPEGIKTTGYLVSCVSVALLGWAAFPGAEKAGLTLVLFAGMAASVLGMGLRWMSYELERRRHTKTSQSAASDTAGSGATASRLSA